MRNDTTENEAYGSTQSANMANDAAGGPGIADNPGDRDPMFEIGGQGDGRTLVDDDAEAEIPGMNTARGQRSDEDEIDEIGNEIPDNQRDDVTGGTGGATGDPEAGRIVGQMAESDASVRQS